MWWRDLHAVTGAFAGVVIFFLAFTGMPWSKFWGTHMQEYASQAGIGYSPALWDDVPTSGATTADVTTRPGWGAADAPVPTSTASTADPITLDQAVAAAHDLGIARGFKVSAPGDATGVYTAAIYPSDLGKERTIHFNQYTGKPLVDFAFRDYGPVGKAIEFGINVHMGQQWGLANQLVMHPRRFGLGDRLRRESVRRTLCRRASTNTDGHLRRSASQVAANAGNAMKSGGAGVDGGGSQTLSAM